jgi:glyoxylase-like metal-dependent hydrolase (beta-lactamase superfamily II)
LTGPASGGRSNRHSDGPGGDDGPEEPGPGHLTTAHTHVHHVRAGESVGPVEPTTIAPGVVQLDTLLGGWQRMTAGYLVEGPAPVLVETGSQSSVPVLLEGLGRLGLSASDLAGIAVTHIHLDHAGGVGDVARAFPRATVYVHEKGARHLADPTRLIDSASRVYGDLLDSLYGRLDPTPAERIHVLRDGEEIVVGPERVLTAIDSPGHAKHHIGLHDSVSGVLFAGDAVGVRLPDAGVLRPATPPPDFDLDQALRSLGKFAARRPTGIALAHYGLLDDPAGLLDEAEMTLRTWAETAEQAWRAGEDIASALAARFEVDLSNVAPEHREKLEVLNGFHSNAAGLRRWLETRNGAGADKAPGAGGGSSPAA